MAVDIQAQIDKILEQLAKPESISSPEDGTINYGLKTELIKALRVLQAVQAEQGGLSTTTQITTYGIVDRSS